MNDPRSERRATTAALLLLVLLPLGWLWPSLFGGRLFVPYDLAGYPPASLQLPAEQLADLRAGSNLDVTEVPVWFLPEWQLARQQLLDGRSPTWNPCARNGTAIHGYGLLGLLYPPNWLMFLDADPRPLLAFTVWLDLALAGLLAFGLLRHLGLGVVPALFGAAVFQLGGQMAANAPFWMRLGSLIWLPGMLWAQLCIADHHRRLPPRPLAALAVCVAMPWLSGFPPYTLATTLLAMAFGLVLLLQRWRRQDGRAALRLLLPLSLGGGLGVLLALPAVLPSLLFFAASARPPVTPAMLQAQRFDLYGLLGLLLPDLFGHPTSVGELPYDRSPLALWLSTVPRGTGEPSNYNYTEYSAFAGTLALSCAGYGAVRGTGRLRWFALGGLLAVLGIATCTPGFGAAYLLPGMANVFPMRWLSPSLLLLAWLAALGLERLLQPHRQGLRVLLVAAAVLAVLAWLLGRDLAPGDGPAAGAWLRQWLPDALAGKYGVDRDQALQYINQDALQDRLLLAQQRLSAELLRLSRWALLAALWCGAVLLAHRRGRRGTMLGWLAVLLAALQLILHGAPLNRGHACTVPTWTPVHDFLAAQRQAAAAQGGFAIARAAPQPTLPSQLPPGQLLAARVRDLHFDSHYDRRSHQPLLALFGSDIVGKSYLTRTLPDDGRLQHPLLDLLGVRYLLATAPLQHAGQRVGPQLRGPGGEFFVYERPQALPRAFVVPELQPVADDQAAVAALAAADFAPRRRAVVTPAEQQRLPAFAPDPRAADRTVTFVRDEPDEVVLHVGVGPPGLLVLADTWLPGWTASIDGAEVELARVDHSLRGLHVGANAATVRFCYRAPGLQAGLNLAGLAALVLLALLAAGRRSSAGRTGAESRM